jgi:hypothetical protein
MMTDFEKRKALVIAQITGKDSPPLRHDSQLDKWILHPGSESYLGRRTMLKLDCLACAIGQPGTTIAGIARRYKISRQAAYHHVRAAREAFGIVKG